MKKKAGLLFITFGLLVKIIAGVFLWSNLYDENRAGRHSAGITQVFYEILQSDAVQDNRAENDQPNGHEADYPISEDDIGYIEIDGAKYIGLISIPSLDVTLPVRIDWSYETLKITPSRYSGHIDDNTLVVMAHNYSTHFADIGGLPTGDRIILTDSNGMTHHYVVVTVTTIDPGSVFEVTNSIYDLTLFTCTIGGETRIVVRAMKIDSYPILMCKIRQFLCNFIHL